MGFVVLMNTPGAARLRLRFDDRSGRLRISADGSLVVEDDLRPAGRERLASAVAEFVLGLDENPLSGHPERLPLRLVGDGVTPRFQDREPGYVTLHSRESLASLGSAIGDPSLDERRFRSNVALEGCEPWEEQEWQEKIGGLGDVQFLVATPVGRCLATLANPETGERDLPILTTLTDKLGQEIPTFAIAMALTGRGGQVRVGDEVRISELP